MFWLMSIPCVLQVLDGYKKAVHRQGEEDKWICVCFFIYLISAIPSIWLLQFKRLDNYKITDNQTNVKNNGSQISCDQDNDDEGFPILLVEQSLLLVVILGRWLLPRGEITREELSQLLFVFIGMGSDIMELFDLFEEPRIRQDEFIKYTIFVVWTMSLTQFCFVLTATKDPNKIRISTLHHVTQEDRGGRCKCLETELWSISISLCLQDGPFLAIRLYSLAYLHIFNHTILFFTAKNVLLVLLIFYRIFVLCLGCVFGTKNEPETLQLRDYRKQITLTKGEQPLNGQKKRKG